MANLKEIKNRIYSIDAIMQITNAMEMVAAAKLKKVKDSILYLREYHDISKQLFHIISSIINNQYNIYNNNNNILLILISSNKGLCGSFNNLIFKKFTTTINESFGNKQIFILTIGKLAKEFFHKKKYNIYADYSSIIDHIYNKKKRKQIINMINELIQTVLKEKFNMIYIIYNKYLTSSSHSVRLKQFFPIIFPTLNYNNTHYIIEPSQHQILQKSFLNFLNIQLLTFLFESSAAEQISRISAMHKATENASDIKNQLMITYNKIRQEIITNELLEVVNGANIY